MAKGRKAKKGKKAGQYSLSNVLMHYKQKNYSTALKQLRNCDIKAHEQEKANYLHSFLPVAIAYQHFSSLEYQKVIELLERTSDDSDKKTLLLGLSFLYTGNFQQAEEYLKKTVQNQKYHLFGFYYLLAIIYGGLEEKADVFFEKHAPIIGSLGKEKQDYLKFFVALMNGEIALAKDFLTHLKTDNTNVQLLNFLLDNTKPEEKLSETKGLYKVLAQLSYTGNEAAYLKIFPTLEEEMEGAKKGTLREKYAGEILELGVNGISMNTVVFDNLLKEVPTTLKPKLLYNQVVACYNSDEQDLNFVRKQIDENPAVFFKIVESLEVYFATFDLENDYYDYRSSYFWRNVNYYFENFYEIFSLEVMNKIAWKVYYMIDMFELVFLDKKQGSRSLREFNKKYNALVAVQFKDISLVFIIRNYKPADASFAIFSNAYFEDYAKLLLEELAFNFERTSLEKGEEELAEMVEKHDLPMPYDVLKKKILEIHIAELTENYNAIYKAFEKHDIHPNNVSVIEVMDMLTLNLKDLITKRQEVNIEHLKSRGVEVYRKIFQTFPQIKKEETEYGLLKNITQLPVVINAVKEAILNEDLGLIEPYIESDLVTFLSTYLFWETLLDSKHETKSGHLFINYLEFLVEKDRLDVVEHFFNISFEKMSVPSGLISVTLLISMLERTAIDSRLLILILKPSLGLLTDEEILDKNLPVIEKIFKLLQHPILAGELDENGKQVAGRLFDYIEKMGKENKLNKKIKKLHKKLSKEL